MLAVVGEKAAEEHLPIERLRANLVELDCLADASVDYAVSLFSTLGMIHGRPNRQRALGHVRRMLKPGGVLVLHVHNFWYNLFDPGGPWWVLKILLRAAIVQDIRSRRQVLRLPANSQHVPARVSPRRADGGLGASGLQNSRTDTARSAPARRAPLAAAAVELASERVDCGVRVKFSLTRSQRRRRVGPSPSPLAPG